MTREIIAAGILALLIGLAVVNITYVSGIVDELKTDVDMVETLSDSGQLQEALELLRKSEQRWLDFSAYAGVMLRHSDEISDVTDSYFAMLEALQSGDKIPGAMCEKLKHGLSDIEETESLTLSSLF